MQLVESGPSQEKQLELQALQKMFPLNLAILRGRNATMVGNIENTFNERSDVNEMLAIVGKLHVPEMKQLLERMGYQSISLPSPSQMQAFDKMEAAATHN